jgi:general secretion pathway protein G
MIELIFVIVILGILAGVAIPRFMATREDAYVAKAQAKVDAVRSGLQNYRSKSLLSGSGATYPSSLDSGGKLFAEVAEGVTSGTSAGKWEVNNSRYTYHTGSHDIVFDYDSGTGAFDCNRSATSPSSLCDDFE